MCGCGVPLRRYKTYYVQVQAVIGDYDDNAEILNNNLGSVQFKFRYRNGSFAQFELGFRVCATPYPLTLSTGTHTHSACSRAHNSSCMYTHPRHVRARPPTPTVS